MNHIAFLFIIILADLTAPFFGQSRTGITIDPNSPYEIAKLVNENHVTQNSTTTPAVLDLKPVWRRLRLEPGSFDECVGDCEAEISKVNLDNKRGAEIILKLTGVSERCRFVVFKRQAKTWKAAGYVDHNFNRYQMARHRLVRFNGTTWLVIRGQEGSGSGFSLYFETWYQLGPTGLRSVLTYPVAGRTYPWPAGLAREFEAATITNSTSDLVVRYRVKYIALSYEGNKQYDFVVNEHHAHFRWADAATSFIFVPSRSNITEAEISIIANVEDEETGSGTTVGSMKFYSGDENKAWVGGGYEVFLKYNLRSLMKIASDKNNEHRAWLRLFLNDCYDTTEKRALIAAFEAR